MSVWQGRIRVEQTQAVAILVKDCTKQHGTVPQVHVYSLSVMYRTEFQACDIVCLTILVTWRLAPGPVFFVTFPVSTAGAADAPQRWCAAISNVNILIVFILICRLAPPG